LLEALEGKGGKFDSNSIGLTRVFWPQLRTAFFYWSS
jgi:hypothetical protein